MADKVVYEIYGKYMVPASVRKSVYYSGRKVTPQWYRGKLHATDHQRYGQEVSPPEDIIIEYWPDKTGATNPSGRYGFNPYSEEEMQKTRQKLWLINPTYFQKQARGGKMEDSPQDYEAIERGMHEEHYVKGQVSRFKGAVKLEPYELNMLKATVPKAYVTYSEMKDGLRGLRLSERPSRGKIAKSGIPYTQAGDHVGKLMGESNPILSDVDGIKRDYYFASEFKTDADVRAEGERWDMELVVPKQSMKERQKLLDTLARRKKKLKTKELIF